MITKFSNVDFECSSKLLSILSHDLTEFYQYSMRLIISPASVSVFPIVVSVVVIFC